MDEREKHVYFIQIGQDGPVKIGESFDPVSRMAAIQSHCPYELRLLGSSEHESEFETHSIFAHLRIRGEWFRPSQSMYEHIGVVCANSVIPYPLTRSGVLRHQLLPLNWRGEW